MMAASRTAIRHTIFVAERLRVPRFLVGFTLVSLGTDSPEIVNSVVSSYMGHGDINVGDSIGSVFTQGALVLGLFPFFIRSAMAVERREMILVPGLTVLALLLGVFLLADGRLSRADGILLILAWGGATFFLFMYGTPKRPAETLEAAPRGPVFHTSVALAAFAVVGAAATGLVLAVTNLASGMGVPEYVLSFFGASIGTSLPELAVEITALRRGERDIALGDVLGSCLVDASLSMGIGAAFFPTAVTATLAVKGAVIGAVTMLLVSALLAMRGKHDRWSGGALIVTYVSAYFVLLS